MRKALIVDDEPDYLSIMEEIVQSFGYEVETAASGEEALERLEAEPPDLMLLDLRMPGIGGIETLIRALKARPDMEILIITGVLDLELRKRLLRIGALDYLTKPLDLEDLRQWLIAHSALSCSAH